MTLKMNSSNGLLLFVHKADLKNESFFRLKVACNVMELERDVFVERNDDGKSNTRTQNKPDNKTPFPSSRVGSPVILTGIFDKIDGTPEGGEEQVLSSFKESGSSESAIKRHSREAKLDSKDSNKKNSGSLSRRRDPRDLPSSSKKKVSSSSTDQTKSQESKASPEVRTVSSSSPVRPCHVDLSVTTGQDKTNKESTVPVADKADKIYDALESIHIEGKLSFDKEGLVSKKTTRGQTESLILRLFLPPFVSFQEMTSPSGSLLDSGVELMSSNSTDFVNVRIPSEHQEHSSSGNPLDFKVRRFHNVEKHTIRYTVHTHERVFPLLPIVVKKTYRYHLELKSSMNFLSIEFLTRNISIL
jgi:hypothetical protein